MIFLRLNSENLAECGTIPQAAFSHRSEAQHTGQSTIHLCASLPPCRTAFFAQPARRFSH